MVTVSIILVNYNGAQVVIDCLRSIQNMLQIVPYEVIVVDNASTDDSANCIETTFPAVQLIRQNQNRGFGAGNNLGAKIAKGKYLFLLNTDTLLICDVLPQLVELMEQNPAIGIVGPQLLNSDKSLQISTARSIGIWGEYQTLKQQLDYQKQDRERIAQEFMAMHEADVIIGAALFIRKSLFEDLSGFDENFFMYFEESDLCERARSQGWKIIYTPSTSLIHLGGYSVKKTADRLRLEYRKSQLYYYKKHRPIWEIIILRLYLSIKFAIIWLLSKEPANLEIFKLVIGLKTNTET